MNKEQRKKWIDNATYEELLSRWRFSPAGSAWFQGEIGDYYQKVMKEKRKEVGDAGHVQASKKIGW